MKSVAIFEMLSSCKLVQWRQLEEKLRSASDPREQPASSVPNLISNPFNATTTSRMF